jgi:hypothetical protein
MSTSVGADSSLISPNVLTRAREARRAEPISADIDVRGLWAELRRTTEGEVRFDAGSRALYASDASNYRQVPIGVCIPKSKDDVVAIVVRATHRGECQRGKGGALGRYVQ